MSSSGIARGQRRRLRTAAVTLTAFGTALIGLTGVASATASSALAKSTPAAATHRSFHASGVHSKAAPVGDTGYTIDPLQYNCGSTPPSLTSPGPQTSCGNVGESLGYYAGTNVDLLYTENFYCDSNVASGATSGCEVGAGPSATPSTTSAGGSGTSLGNTTHGDSLYIPVPLFTPVPVTQCDGVTTCIDHPPTVDLHALGGPFATATNVAIPAHDHVVTTRNNGLPEWWNVKVVPVATQAAWNTFLAAGSLTPAQIAAAAGTNIFLFFQVMPGTIPTAVATDPAVLTSFAPLLPPVAKPADPTPGANQAEAGNTFNNLFNDCGQSAPNCQNVGVAHGWVAGTPGALGQDTQLLYTESYFCDQTVASGAPSKCEAGAPAAHVPPGVADTVNVPTAANSVQNADGTNKATHNGNIDPLYIPVPIGFTPDYAQCPGVIVCIDHPATIDLSRLATALGAPAAALTNVPLPSHDHVIPTRNADQPEWWNVEVVPVTSQVQLSAIELNKNLTLAQEAAAVDTNAYLWFQTLPGASNPTPGPVKTNCMTTLPAGGVVGGAALPDGTGYIETDSKGDVAVFGAAACYGAMTGTTLNKPIVGIAVDRQTGGYWLVASDGGVFAFNAQYEGSTGNLTLNKPVVGITTDLNSQGYWLVASDGGVFSFGLPFLGSTGNLKLNKPVVGMGYDLGTGGYMLVASDGGVFNFLSTFYGSTGGMTLNQPVVAVAPLSNGSGYREIAADGGVFDFPSTTPFLGSLGGLKLNQPIVSAANDNSNDGYWAFAADGGVFTFGTHFFGSAA